MSASALASALHHRRLRSLLALIAVRFAQSSHTIAALVASLTNFSLLDAYAYDSDSMTDAGACKRKAARLQLGKRVRELQPSAHAVNVSRADIDDDPSGSPVLQSLLTSLSTRPTDHFGLRGELHCRCRCSASLEHRNRSERSHCRPSQRTAMSARQRGSSGSNSAAGAAPAVASSSSAASFFTRLQHAVSPSLHPIPILPRLEWSKSINPANPLDVIRGAQLLNVKAAGGAAAAAAASDEAAPLTALQQAQALQARSKWLESPPPAPVTAAGPAASSSVAASAAPSSQPAAASSQPNSQRPQSTQQSQPGANSRMRRSLESATAKPLHYSGAAVAGFTSSRQRNKAAASFDRRTSLRSCIDLTSPEPIDEPSSDDDDEEDDGMSDGEQPQHTIGRAAAPSAAVAAAAAPVATVAMDEEPRLAAPVATPAAISTRWQWQTLLPTTLSQSIAAPASHSLASAPQRNAAAPSSSSQAAAAPPQNTIRELHQANGSSSVPVTILSLMASNPPLPFKASRPTARLATLAAPSKPVPSLHSWQKASKLFAPIKDDDTDDFIPNSDASPIPVSPPRSSVTKRVVAPSVQRAASFSSSSASVSHASPISTDGASTSDEEVDDEDEDDERGSESTGGCPLPWCNDLTGSPPPRYKHLTHNNEESAGYKALPRLISKGCKCHSRGMNCSLSTCACMRMGTAGYNKEGLLVAQETRKSNSKGSGKQ